MGLRVHADRGPQRADPRQEGGGVYSPGVPLAFGADFHATYFNDWLRFAGITDVTEVRWQPTVLTGTPDEDRAAAARQATEAGTKF
jgi:FMN-dependent NADH-azoreductase